MSRPDIDDVLARLKQLFDIASDSALSRQLDTSPQTISSWRARQRVPYAICIEIALQYDISLDWLLMGRGAMSPLPQEVLTDTGVAPEDQDRCVEEGYERSIHSNRLMETFSRLSERDQHDVSKFVEEKLRIRDMEQRLLILEHQVKSTQLLR